MADTSRLSDEEMAWVDRDLEVYTDVFAAHVNETGQDLHPAYPTLNHITEAYENELYKQIALLSLGLIGMDELMSQMGILFFSNILAAYTVGKQGHEILSVVCTGKHDYEGPND